jgi:molybdate transport system substrate-binding protein
MSRSKTIAFAAALWLFILPNLSPAHADTQTLTIFAAASMNESLTTLGHEFEKSNPGVSVRFSFLSSATLATQLNQGAPADLFVSASISEMMKARSRISAPTTFITNRVVIAVPKSNPKNILKAKDLNKKGIKWIQCAQSAPCGAAADAAIAAEKTIRSTPVSFESNDANVVAKLLIGEVDAAIVYHTDIVSHLKELKAIGFRDQKASLTTYEIGIVDDSKLAIVAKSFLIFLTSAKSETYLKRRGFGRIT